MKRILGAVAGMALVLTGLTAGPVQAKPPVVEKPCDAKTVAKGYICNPNGVKVKKLPPLEGKQASDPTARSQSANKIGKGKPAAPLPPSRAKAQASCASTCYIYNGLRQGNWGSTQNFAGARVNMKIGGQTGTAGTPSARNLGSDGFHTLMENSVHGEEVGDIIEVGAIQGQGVNGVGNFSARPFVFYWVNDKGQGYNGGQFVPVSGSTFVPGTTNLTANASYETEIWHDSTQAVWWIGFNAVGSAKNWMGYYADDIWTDDTKWVAGTTGAEGPMTKMDYVQMFAESATTVDHPCNDLGNGLIASNVNAASFTNAAYLSQVTRATNPTLINLNTFREPTATTGTTFSNTYSLGPAGAQVGARVGGPQWDKATGTVTGIVGC